MLASSHGGKNPPKTTDESSGRNNGRCEICGDRADGFDAETRQNLCSKCASRSYKYRINAGVDRINAGVSDR